MSVIGNSSSPIIDSSLLLWLDAANPKSLVAPPSTNIMIWSQDFTKSNWNKSRSSISANVILAPDKTLTASKLIDDISNDTHYIRSDGYNFSVGETFTISGYFKAAELTWASIEINEAGVVFPTIYINLTTGKLGTTSNLVTATIQPFDDGWYRLCVTRTVVNAGLMYIALITSNVDNGIRYTGNGTSGIYVWGVQLEKLPYVTPYMATLGASVGRNSWVDLIKRFPKPILYTSNGQLVDNKSIIPTTANTYQMTISNNIDFVRQDGTISLWVKLTNGNNTTSITIFSAGGSSNNRIDFYRITQNPLNQYYWLMYYTTNTVSNNVYIPAINYYINVWVNTVITYNSIGMAAVYVNGILINKITIANFIKWNITNINPSTIQTYTNGNDIGGAFGQLMYYTRMLSQTEIFQNYNAHKSKYGL